MFKVMSWEKLVENFKSLLEAYKEDEIASLHYSDEELVKLNLEALSESVGSELVILTKKEYEERLSQYHRSMEGYE